MCPLTVLSSGDMDGHWWDHASWHSEASSMSMVRLVFNSPLHVLFLLLFISSITFRQHSKGKKKNK